MAGTKNRKYVGNKKQKVCGECGRFELCYEIGRIKGSSLRDDMKWIPHLWGCWRPKGCLLVRHYEEDDDNGKQDKAL